MDIHGAAFLFANDGFTSDGLTSDGLTSDGLTSDGLTNDGYGRAAMTPPAKAIS